MFDFKKGKVPETSKEKVAFFMSMTVYRYNINTSIACVQPTLFILNTIYT